MCLIGCSLSFVAVVCWQGKRWLEARSTKQHIALRTSMLKIALYYYEKMCSRLASICEVIIIFYEPSHERISWSHEQSEAKWFYHLYMTPRILQTPHNRDNGQVKCLILSSVKYFQYYTRSFRERKSPDSIIGRLKIHKLQKLIQESINR